MTGEDWGNDFGRAVMLFVNGEGIRERGQYGQRHVDDSFLLCFNAHDAPIEFAMPSARVRPEVGTGHRDGRTRRPTTSGSSRPAAPSSVAGPLARRAGPDGLSDAAG